MNRKEKLSEEQKNFFDNLSELYFNINKEFKNNFNRSVSLGDAIVDRWDKAKFLGFGEGTNVYDSCLVLGDAEVGKHCWIGPYTIIDGSGGLVIGDNCTISAGVHIYTHDNVFATISPNNYQIAKASVKIGNNVYIAPNCIIAMGVEIGSHSIVAANSFVNKSFPSNSIIAGTPAKVIGKVEMKPSGEVELLYK